MPGAGHWHLSTGALKSPGAKASPWHMGSLSPLGFMPQGMQTQPGAFTLGGQAQYVSLLQESFFPSSVQVPLSGMQTLSTQRRPPGQGVMASQRVGPGGGMPPPSGSSPGSPGSKRPGAQEVS